MCNYLYKKIKGLRKLQSLSLDVPPYVIVFFHPNRPVDFSFIERKIDRVGIPMEIGDCFGVTVRVSRQKNLDKEAKHGGLHLISKKEILEQVIKKHDEYPDSKIIVQHTVDARCSGGLLKERDAVFLEAVQGDAPPLLEGTTDNYESWVLNPNLQCWHKKRDYTINSQNTDLITFKDLNAFSDCAKKIEAPSILEWSISKDSKLYFYEYRKLNELR